MLIYSAPMLPKSNVVHHATVQIMNLTNTQCLTSMGASPKFVTENLHIESLNDANDPGPGGLKEFEGRPGAGNAASNRARYGQGGWGDSNTKP